MIRRSGAGLSKGTAVGGAGTLGSVRIATWNVNSVKQRVPRLLPWLDERRPDVVALQETKLTDDAFAELLGEELSVRGLEGGPGFPHQEARAVTATCDGVRITSVYVPNGRQPGSDHYAYKLEWLHALREVVAQERGEVVVCGDMNIAPSDEDVFDPDAYVGQTHVTEPERAALAELQNLGLRDVVRDHWPSERVF